MKKIRKVYNEITRKEIFLPEKCEKIISFSPALTESLFLMGLGELVKGVSVYCVHPEEARKKTILGSYNSFKEKLIEEINPDIIFTTTGYQLELVKKLEDKFPLYPIRLPPTVAELIGNCVEVGLVAGYVEKARELEFNLLNELNKLLSFNQKNQNKIYIEIDLGGPVTFGAYSYITDGINLIGGKNIFQDENCEWLIPDDKKVSLLNPDIIIYEPKMFSKERNAEIIKEKLLYRFGEVDALKRGNLFITPGLYDFFAHHGPSFIINVLPWLRQILLETA